MPRVRSGLRAIATSAAVVIGTATAIAAFTFPIAPSSVAGASSTPWTWTDRSPALNAVSCSAASTCVGVGTGGSVLRTNDGGATLQWSEVPWTKQQAEQLESLVGVSCWSSICVAISGKSDATSATVSVAYRSTDGGAKWVRVGPLPAAAGRVAVANAVACDGHSTCVAVGLAGGIWRSADQGATWKAIVPPGTPQPYTAGVTCPAIDTCLAPSETPSPTGATSVSRIVGTTVTAVSLPTTGTATALGCSESSLCLATTITNQVARSTDAGKTWEALSATLPITPDVHVASLDCPKPKTCTGLTSSPPKRVIRTTDAGNTWRLYSLGAPGATPPPPAALDCAVTGCATVGAGALLQRSADGGASWKTVNVVPGMSTLWCGPPSGTPSEATCMSGGMSDVGKSVTTGQFWNTPLGGVMGLSAEHVSCLSPPGCIDINEKSVLTSPDEGQSWQFATTAGSVGTSPKAATCVTATYCVAVGDGVVFTTLNGATTWSLSTVPGAPGLTSLSCPSTTVCYAMPAASGDNGAVYRGVRTIDPAHPDRVFWTWQSFVTPAQHPLNAISCPTETVCTAVGTHGLVERTTNGGVDWSETVTNPDDTLSAVSCTATGACLAGGTSDSPLMGRALVATSQDGGQTWTRQPQPMLGTIKSVTCPTATRCLAGGDVLLVGKTG